MSQSVKKKQIITMIAVGGFLMGLIFFGLWVSDPNKGKPTLKEKLAAKPPEKRNDFLTKPSANISAEETWIEQSELKIKTIETENQMLKKRMAEMEAMLKKVSEDQKTSSDNALQILKGGELIRAEDMPSFNNENAPPLPNDRNFTTLPPPPVNAVPQVKKLNQPPIPSVAPPSNRPLSSGLDENGKPIEEIMVVDLSPPSTDLGGNPKEKIKNVESFLPAGSFSTVVFLSGVDAPTGGQAKTNPVPVLMRVVDNGSLPNFFKSQIKDCHIGGAAYGDIASERVHIRTELISCTLINGDIIQEELKGFVAGEDGKAGMRGKLVSKQGQLIAKSLMAGLAGGLGSSVSQQYRQISTSALGAVSSVQADKALQNGLANGASNAMEKIADYYLDRANEIYPVIEMDAKRIGEVILTSGTDLKINIIGNTKDEESN